MRPCYTTGMATNNFTKETREEFDEWLHDWHPEVADVVRRFVEGEIPLREQVPVLTEW